MTTTPIILRDDDYWSETEQVHVENRGAAFGKITVWNEDVAVAQFTWAGNGTIRPIGLGEPSRAYKERAIRALAETPWGAKALGTDQRTPEFIAATRRHHIGNPHNINPAGDATPTPVPDSDADPVSFAVLEELHERITLLARRARADAVTDGRADAWEKAVALQTSLLDIGNALGCAARLEAAQR